MLLPAVIPHFYPVLLQRSILLRLQPLLDNAAARRPIADWDTTEIQRERRAGAIISNWPTTRGWRRHSSRRCPRHFLP